jgi:hypothetical protein
MFRFDSFGALLSDFIIGALNTLFFVVVATVNIFVVMPQNYLEAIAKTLDNFSFFAQRASGHLWAHALSLDRGTFRDRLVV